MARKKHGLDKKIGDFPELQEIQEFVAIHAPRIEVRANFLVPGLAFVYPKAYQRPLLAILGGMYVLWRNEREKAKGILLHEIEHVRQGDHLLVGYGSFFVAYLRYLILGFLVLMAAHIIIGTPISVGFVKEPGYLQFEYLYLYIDEYRRSVLGYLCVAIGMITAILFILMSRIIIPLMAIWSLEFNADYNAGQQKKIAFDEYTGSARWTSKIYKTIGSLTHPPLWFRRWLLEKDDWTRSLIRHLVFPLSRGLAVIMYLIGGLIFLC